MKNKIFFLIFSFLFLNIQGQNQVLIDSLVNGLKTNISEKQKVDTYNKLSKEIRRTDSLQAMTYVNKALAIADEINYKNGILDARFEEAYISNLYGKPELAIDQYTALIESAAAIGYKKIIGKSNFQIGFIYKDKSDYSSSIQYNIKSAVAFEEIKDTLSCMIVYSYIAGQSLYQDNYTFALEYYLKLLDLGKKRKSNQILALCYNNIGIIHKENEEYDDAIENYKNSLTIYEKINDSARIGDCLNNIGALYIDNENYPEAMIYLKKSLNIRLKLNNTTDIVENYNNLGEIEFRLKNYAESLENYFKAIHLYKNNKKKLSKAHSLIGIGKVYYEQNKFGKAKQYLKEGIQLAKETSLPDLISNGSNYLSKVEHKLGNYKNAYDNHLLYAKIKDSLGNNEMLKKLTIMNANFAFEQQLDSINYKNDKDQLLLSQRIESERKINTFMFVSLITILGLIIILYNKNKDIKQVNIELEKQRNELDSMNKTKTRLFSIIAHDIRGPIGNFIGLYDLLKDHLKDNYTEVYNNDAFLDSTVTLLNKTKDQLLDLLDGLVNWALKESNVIPYRPETLNVKVCVDKNIAIYLPQAKSKNIQLAPKIDENISIWADKNSVMTIIRNLTGNALKFSPENSIISYEASVKNNFTEIKITDQGVGMEPDKLKNIFAIHEEKTTLGTKGEKGTGLGLNIVWDFVKLNNGTISVESTINVGTTFIITLPNKQT
ncbi:tetratricopeptide repeat protein [Bacteroidota bacterium]